MTNDNFHMVNMLSEDRDQNYEYGIRNDKKVRNGENKSISNYEYETPLTSPFYDYFLSPFCDFLVNNVVPNFIEPDNLSYMGLACGSLAIFFACQTKNNFNDNILFEYRFLFAGILWILYSIFDNLDGKQARKLKKSSPGGEFLDHTCDSIIVTLCTILWTQILIPERMQNYKIFICQVGGQIPFYIATWGHLTYGRLILGPKFSGTHWLTVDEFNFLMLPGLCFLRQFRPNFWDDSIPNSLDNYIIEPSLYRMILQKIPNILDCPDNKITYGVLLILFIIGFSMFHGLKVAIEVWDWKHFDLILPGIFFFHLALWFKSSLALILTPFSLLCMELQVYRLLLREQRRILHLWWPLVLFLFLNYIDFIQKRHIEMTYRPYLSNFIDLFPIFILLRLLVLYKNKINLYYSSKIL